ncbi:hypothetical protein [Helicobacter pylori]|uniref:hypothetical protein n=1 Tax=Helicobacter pylori TaxID=210 RepID=UPI001E56730B|nr:hypothetical protein [Helicobacter pylori]
MNNDLIEAIQDTPIANKLQPYLKRRGIIFNYAQACVGELAQKLESVELEKATLTLTFEKWIDPMIKEMQEHQQEARYNLDRSTEKFISDLEKSAARKINQFESDFRKEMHERIERDIGNNECKEIFDNELKQRETKLIEDIKRRFKECEERFDEEIKEDIERFKEKIKDSLKMLECISIDSGNFDFNTDFNIDNGIDGFALGASIGGLVLLVIVNIWNPVGWVELAIVGFVALVGIGKSIWSFFDSDYKKSQQRKNVDEKLDEACEKIAENVRDNLEIAKKDILEKIEKLKAELNGTVENYEYKKERLKEVNKRLGYISNDIKARSMQ